MCDEVFGSAASLAGFPVAILTFSVIKPCTNDFTITAMYENREF
jgi:hypothetical protein